MRSTSNTIDEYLDTLPDDRKAAINQLCAVLRQHLPAGFSEEMSYGMIGYVVPHALYPTGYHSNPALPLPFINVGSQKNYVVFHHVGLYCDEALLNWFVGEYPKHSKTKLDMGKGCVRFKKPDQIPYTLLGELAAKLTPDNWITIYEQQRKGIKSAS
ncbi:DUF1801 domain-containing protein [Fibrella sp. WM1]|uniref:DUF1801 domain-containing protein n=1 Tax=Fibrella musci TaxID=3242485 RepID=UPI0035229AEE